MDEYPVECFSCLAEYDANTAVWCGCDPKSPTKMCPFCLQCFCQATDEYKEGFWRGAGPNLKEDLATLAKARERLGDMLIKAHMITTDQLLAAIKTQKESGEKLGEVFIRSGYIAKEDLDTFLARQQTTHSTDLSKLEPNRALIAELTLAFCREKRLVPIEREDLKNKRVLTVAMADPTDSNTKAIVKERTGCQIIALSALASQVAEFLDGLTDLPAAEGGKPGPIHHRSANPTLDLGIQAPDTGDLSRAKQILNQLIVGAVKRGASDLHLEPIEEGVATHYRIDGVLFKVRTPADEPPARIIQAVKEMAGLCMEMTNVPQDGKVLLKVKETRYKLIVHSFPTSYGENISIKLIDRDTFVKDVYNLGIDESVLSDILFGIGTGKGLVVLSAPLFSGVSTTQYALMAYLHKSRKKVATIENPIICPVEGIRQSEVKIDAGYTFSQGLQALVSSYPDVIVLSEFRDRETVSDACRIASRILLLAATEGSSASETLVSLLDLGVPGNQLAGAVTLVVNQRLLRRICPHCLVEQRVEQSEANLLGLDIRETKEFKFFRGKGCPKCNGIGYRGRIAIFEVQKMDDDLRGLLRNGATAAELQETSIAKGMRSLRRDCIEKMRNGHTTFEEFLKAGFE